MRIVKALWPERGIMSHQQKKRLIETLEKVYFSKVKLEVMYRPVHWSITLDGQYDQELNRRNWLEAVQDFDIVVGLFKNLPVLAAMPAGINAYACVNIKDVNDCRWIWVGLLASLTY